MSRVVILTDSTADLPDSFVSEYNITVLPLSIIWDGSSYRDGVDMRPQEFYRRLKGARELPTTSQVTTPAFESAFASIIERGDCVLAMLVSSKLSGTYDAAIQAREAVPAARDKIAVLDFGQALGGLVTVIAVLGVIPYISLQLKAISSSFTILLHHPDLVIPAQEAARPFLQDSALYIAMLLAAFTILFGTRHLDATERHEGLVAAIAFESVVKLLAFLAVGAFVTYGVYGGVGDVFARAQQDPRLDALLTVPPGAASYGTWGFVTVLSMLSIMFLPRQFQISVVENVDEGHLGKAIWLFPLYLLLINVFVLPVALGGLVRFAGGGVDADTFVLTFPMAERQEALALFVFIGGLSAGTGMVIVETIALSTMVCNDLVMPVLLRQPWMRLRRDVSGLLILIRRVAIAAILVLGPASWSARSRPPASRRSSSSVCGRSAAMTVLIAAEANALARMTAINAKKKSPSGSVQLSGSPPP